MKRLTGMVLLFVAVLLYAQLPSPRQIALPSSKHLEVPAPGWVARLNSFPANIVVSPDGRYAAILNNGYGTLESRVRQSVAVFDLASNHIVDFPDDRLVEDARQSYFLGLAFSSDGKRLYASVGSLTDPDGAKAGSTGNGILVYNFQQGKLAPQRVIKLAAQKLAPGKKVALALRQSNAGAAIPYPAGLALARRDGKDVLLVANNLSDNAILLDPETGSILKSFDLSVSPLVPASFPYSVVVSRDGRRAWCSLWNASTVAELDLDSGTVARWIPLLQPREPIAPGSHPTAMLLSPDGKLLYAALSNADAVAVVSTETNQRVGLLDTRISGQSIAGTTPNALAQSADGKRLFVADASLNAVAVFDVSRSYRDAASEGIQSQAALGFIPTEWYPSALAVNGSSLLIASAKGQGSGANGMQVEVQSPRRHREHPYIPTLVGGSVAKLDLPETESRLASYTAQVIDQNRLRSDPGKIEFAGGRNPIRHVIYVIKENRTYDQIFGDLKVGNGDPSLTMYGEDITPNLHKLALQFGVIDNFYDSGEVSGDGHVWTNAAITSDYNEKTWQVAYRSKERSYDFGGTNNDEYMLEYGLPDVDDPATGFLWDNVARHGLTYRVYGEFIGAQWCKEEAPSPPPQEGTPSNLRTACPRDYVRKGEPLPPNLGQPHGSGSPWPWPVPLMRGVKPSKEVLRGHYDPLYPDFEVDYPDQLRADEFLNEFEGFVRARKDGKGAELPAFVLLYLPDDHTGGTRVGKPSPQASVADNDLALGRVVEAVSHSPYWDDTAVFVIEDDAQDGADHVDAHRSTALVISKYSPSSPGKPLVAHDFYNTVSMIHTIEALLGLPPMNLNDAYAPLMKPLFAGEGSQPPFVADSRNRENGLIYRVNTRKSESSEASSRMDFSRPDAVDTERLNAILWRDAKGNLPMPAPRH